MTVPLDWTDSDSTSKDAWWHFISNNRGLVSVGTENFSIADEVPIDTIDSIHYLVGFNPLRTIRSTLGSNFKDLRIVTAKKELNILALIIVCSTP